MWTRQSMVYPDRVLPANKSWKLWFECWSQTRVCRERRSREGHEGWVQGEHMSLGFTYTTPSCGILRRMEAEHHGNFALFVERQPKEKAQLWKKWSEFVLSSEGSSTAIKYPPKTVYICNLPSSTPKVTFLYLGQCNQKQEWKGFCSVSGMLSAFCPHYQNITHLSH